MVFACAASLVLHFAVVIAIQGQPRDTDADTGSLITARLEPARAAEPESFTPQETDQTLLMDATSAVSGALEQLAASDAIPTLPDTAQAERKPKPPEPAALEIPVIRDPTYYAARFLDDLPKPLSPIEPRYPQNASITNVSGSVTLLLLIDEQGTLQEASVVEAKPEALFDEAALAAFRGIRFSPARKDGRAVRSRVLVTVGFEADQSSAAR